MSGNLYHLRECPDCGMVLNGRSYNIDESRAECTKVWHKRSARSREFVDARAVIDTPEALDAAQAMLPGVARSTVRTALLDAMRAAVDPATFRKERVEPK